MLPVKVFYYFLWNSAKNNSRSIPVEKPARSTITKSSINCSGSSSVIYYSPKPVFLISPITIATSDIERITETKKPTGIVYISLNVSYIVIILKHSLYYHCTKLVRSRERNK